MTRRREPVTVYSVFLVEDEVVIREGIREIINWQEYGFSFVGEAADGELAWPLIQKQKPDILITDIKMPFMDGLALSRLVKKELPETTIIILSGYDDFSYAKEAIAIGVSQYLLKPLAKDQLISSLSEVKARKDKEAEQNRYREQFDSEMQAYLTGSQRDLWDALVSGKYAAEELLARADKFQLDFTAEAYNIVLFFLEEDLLHANYSTKVANAQADLCAAFPQNSNCVMFSTGVDSIAFLVKGEKIKIDAVTSQCVEMLETICRPLEKVVKWSVVTGEPVFRLSAVADCYRAARQTVFRFSGNDVAPNAPVALDFDPNDMDAAKVDQRIVERFLASGLQEEIHDFIRSYMFSAGGDAAQSLIFRQYIVLNMRFTINAFLEKMGYSKKDINRETKEERMQEAFLTFEGAEKYTEQLLSTALMLRDKSVNNRYGTMLQKAVDYMNEHYADPDISLNVVAQVANVSATHFSAVFSQEMGKTFLETLTDLRMEQARALLRSSDKSSGEVAFAVGYNDPHYFSFLFKKVNGCSPRDYRSGRKTI